VLADGGTLKVGPITSDITGIAAKLRALHKSLKLPDAIHVATALAFGCTHLLTADTRLKNVYHLPPDPKFAASSHVYVSQHSLEIIRPDQPTLTGLLAEFAD
jgi:hypothetical protein